MPRDIIAPHSKELWDWLRLIGIDTATTRRVVIDIPSNGAVTIYIEKFGTRAMLSVEPPPELGTAIKIDADEVDDQIT